MPNEKLPLRGAREVNALLTIQLILAVFASCFVAMGTASRIERIIGYSFVSGETWAFGSKYYNAVIGFSFFFILYLVFRFVIKHKIHFPIITAISVNIAVFIIPVLLEYNTPREKGFWQAEALTITIEGYFIFQLFIFGAFTIAISLLDRHTALKAWKRIIIAFAIALPVGAFMSWAAWSQMEKLYIEMRGNDFALLALGEFRDRR